jgi:Pregnancy-associated plasma protein-A
VHEVGHWFALAHTFNGGCRAFGDDVDDTLAEKSTERLPGGRDKRHLPRGTPDSIHNFITRMISTTRNRPRARTRTRPTPGRRDDFARAILI